MNNKHNESCLNCYHFPVCYVSQKEAREKEAWNGDLIEFYQRMAGNCDYYDNEEDIRKRKMPYIEKMEEVKIS